MDWATLGREIRARRKNAKLTQDEIGAAIGTTGGFISELERGRCGASVEALEGIAKALGAECVVAISAPGEEAALIAALRRALPHMSERARNSLRGQLDGWIAPLEESTKGPKKGLDG